MKSHKGQATSQSLKIYIKRLGNRRRGLVTRGRGDTIYLGPALVMQPPMIKRVVDIIAESVHTVLASA